MLQQRLLLMATCTTTAQQQMCCDFAADAPIPTAAAAAADVPGIIVQVLDIQPMPLFEQSGRDGRKTEDLVHRLVKRQLPPGWRLYSGARLLKTDDEVFPNQKFLKGEADLLLTDPEGVVQAVLEVKTASGNLFLALSEDVVR